MSERNTLIRSMHDVGLAAWFGGSLMGAVGLNGAASNSQDPPRLAADGWGRWAPVNAAAIGVHSIGGLGLILANRGRVAHQQGAGANTVIKLALTGAAMGVTAYSGMLGKRIAQEGDIGLVGGEGATEPSPYTPDAAASSQQQLKRLQWAIPALTGTLIVLAAQQGEQQKPSQLAGGLRDTTLRRLSRT